MGIPTRLGHSGKIPARYRPRLGKGRRGHKPTRMTWEASTELGARDFDNTRQRGGNTHDVRDSERPAELGTQREGHREGLIKVLSVLVHTARQNMLFSDQPVHEQEV